MRAAAVLLLLLVPLAAPSAADGTVETPFRIEGRTGTAVCLGVGAVRDCRFLEDPRGTWNALADLAPGTPVRMRGELRWSADPAPPLPLMQLYLQGFRDGQFHNFAAHQGPSPLAFDWDLVAFGGSDYNTNLHHGRPVGGGFVAGAVELGADFVFEGVLTTAS